MNNRPYLAEVEQINLQQSIDFFNQTRSCGMRNPKNDFYERSARMAGDKNLKIKYSAIKNEKEAKKELKKIVLSMITVFIALSSTLFFKAEVNDKMLEFNNAVKNNQLIESNIELEKESLLNNIDGQNYIQYVQETLGMRKNSPSQYVYLSVSEYRDERERGMNND